MENEEIDTATEEQANKPTPPLKFFIRARDAVQGYFGPPEIKQDPNLTLPPAQFMEFSKDGQYLGAIHANEIVVYETQTGRVVQKFETVSGKALAFSPLNTYLITYERLTPEKPNNLNLWRVQGGELIQSWSQKAFSSETWPALKWNEDEKVCGHLVSNEVDFYETPNFSTIVNRLRLPNIANFALSPGRNMKVAAFVPEKKGAPAFVRLYRYPQLETHVAAKSFFKAQECKLMWNSIGSAILLMTHTDVDKTGKSYYGETGLYFLQSDGKFDCNVTLKQDGPIYDVGWNPNGKQFVVTYGFMPSQTTIFDQKCHPIADFGHAARNTIKWSHHDRLICLGGFGNLSGNMEIWDPKKLKKISNATADYSSAQEWSPDSQYMLTGVLFPRMKIDNGFKVWKYDGTQLYSENRQELYQVAWVPALPGVFPPPRVAEVMKKAEEEPPKPSPGKYIPPHAVGRATTASIKKPETAPVKYSRTPHTIPKVQGPPGYSEEPSKSSKRNKRRRGTKKKGEGETEEDDKEEVEEEKQEATPSSPSQKEATPTSPQDTEKKLKVIQKKLRQIDTLKEQQASGQKLEKSALDKLATEAKLRAELEQLSIDN